MTQHRDEMIYDIIIYRSNQHQESRIGLKLSQRGKDGKSRQIVVPQRRPMI